MDVWNVESYKNVLNVTLKQTNNKQTNNYKKKKKTINRWRTRSIKGITNMKILGHAKCNNKKKSSQRKTMPLSSFLIRSNYQE